MSPTLLTRISYTYSGQKTTTSSPLAHSTILLNTPPQVELSTPPYPKTPKPIKSETKSEVARRGEQRPMLVPSRMSRSFRWWTRATSTQWPSERHSDLQLGVLWHSYVCSPVIYLISPLMRECQVLILLIIIPLPLFFAQTIYGVAGLSAWVIIGIIWCFGSAVSVVIYPLYESREALGMIARGIIKVRSPI